MRRHPPSNIGGVQLFLIPNVEDLALLRGRGTTAAVVPPHAGVAMTRLMPILVSVLRIISNVLLGRGRI